MNMGAIITSVLVIVIAIAGYVYFNYTSVLVIVIAIAGYVYFNYQDKKREIHKDRT